MLWSNCWIVSLGIKNSQSKFEHHILFGQENYYRNKIHNLIQYRIMSKARILIVEDETIVAMDLESSLTALG